MQIIKSDHIQLKLRVIMLIEGIWRILLKRDTLLRRFTFNQLGKSRINLKPQIIRVEILEGVNTIALATCSTIAVVEPLESSILHLFWKYPCVQQTFVCLAYWAIYLISSKSISCFIFQAAPTFIIFRYRLHH